MNRSLIILILAEGTCGDAWQAEAEARGMEVLRTQTLMATLGQYIVSFPDAVVIDAAHGDAEAAVMHLVSVDAAPLIVAAADRTPPWAAGRRGMTVTQGRDSAAILHLTERLARRTTVGAPVSLNERASA